jgi:hypothetical protein
MLKSYFEFFLLIFCVADAFVFLRKYFNRKFFIKLASKKLSGSLNTVVIWFSRFGSTVNNISTNAISFAIASCFRRAVCCIPLFSGEPIDYITSHKLCQELFFSFDKLFLLKNSIIQNKLRKTAWLVYHYTHSLSRTIFCLLQTAPGVWRNNLQYIWFLDFYSLTIKYEINKLLKSTWFILYFIA